MTPSRPPTFVSCGRSVLVSALAFALANLIAPPAWAETGVTNIVNGGTTNYSSGYTVGTNGSFNALIVTNAGVMTVTGTNIVGYSATATSNSIWVTGAGSVLSNSAFFYVGRGGSFNQLIITNGGAVFGVSGYLGVQGGSSNNSALVTGPGSIWSNSSALWIGYTGSFNQLTIANGGQVVGSSAGAIIGARAGANNNSVLVTGAGSVWNNSGNVSIGLPGNSGNQLIITNGGVVQTAGSLTLYANNMLLNTAGGSLYVGGNFDNQATNQAGNDFSGTTIFNGGGVTQRVEVASVYATAGPGSATNFYFGTFQLGDPATGSNAWVQLVNNRVNTAGGSNETLGANNLVVLAGSTLDWNNNSGYVANLSNSGTMLWTNTGNPAGTVLRLDVVNTFTNQGVMEIDNGTVLRLSNAFLNADVGVISLVKGGVMTNFAAGGVLTNQGVISGDGLVVPAVSNVATGNVTAVTGTLLLGGGIANNVNYGELQAGSGGTLSVNNGVLTNASGAMIDAIGGIFTMVGAGSNVVNHGMIGTPSAGYGTMAVTIDNEADGSITATGGVLRLTGGLTNNVGAAVNAGLLAVLAGELNVATAFTNVGAIAITNGVLTAPGVDNSGSIVGYGTFNAALNNTGGVTNNTSGQTLTFAQSVNNNAGGTLMAVGGGSMVFSNAVNNLGGMTAAGGGNLTFSYGMINNGSITVQDLSMATFAGAVTNAGAIVLSSGTVTAPSVNNSGSIRGYGTFNAALNNTGSVTNNTGGQTLAFVQSVNNNAGGTMTAAGGSMAFSNVVNNLGGMTTASGGSLAFNNAVLNSGSITVQDQSTAAFAGAVTNAGTITVQNQSLLTFSAGLTNNGTLAYGPAVNPSTTIISGSLTLGSGGIIAMGSVTNNTLVVQGNFVNGSTNNNSFNMANGVMTFGAAGSLTTNTFEVAGRNLGTNFAGFNNNFAVGTLNITNGIRFVDYVNNGGGGNSNEVLYVDVLHLFSGSTMKLSALTIYVGVAFIDEDSTGSKTFNGGVINQGNAASLGLLNVSMDNGGQIVFVPEPGTWALLALGLGSVAARRTTRGRILG